MKKKELLFFIKKNGLKKYIKWFGIFVKCCIARILLVFIGANKKYKNLWLFAERGNDARDNAMHLFRYVCKNHSDVNAVYIITKDSPDLKNVQNVGPVVYHGSWQHYLCYLASTKKVSAHIFGGAPERNLFLRMDHVSFLKKLFVKGKYVFLQHGVTQADGPWLHRDKVRFDLFVTVSKREEQFVIERFGHPAQNVKSLGFARYDALSLSSSKSKKILLMPTWRHYLSKCTAETFEKTDYFRTFNSLLNSERLLHLLDQYGYELIFYPHFEMQKFLHLFTIPEKNVIAASFENYDVQKLMIECDMMITDYSSVQFDFAYMKKPILLYQFDRAAYQNGHQGKGYFDPDSDAFGPVAKSLDDVVVLVEQMLSQDCKMSEQYIERMKSFFLYNDTQNCLRNFNAIREL